MAKRCRSCCGGGFCITSAKFYDCSNVTGFTAAFYSGWSTGTTAPGPPEFTSPAITSLPYCYTPANPGVPYSILFQKAGWIDVVLRAGNAPSGATVNLSVGLAPVLLNVTQDNGSGTITAGSTATFFQTTSGTGFIAPQYNGCFTVNASVVCRTVAVTPPLCSSATAGTYAFTLSLRKSTTGLPGCNTTSTITILQTVGVEGCNPGGVASYLSSTCSAGAITTTCAGGVSTFAMFSPTVKTGCSTPFNETFTWARGGGCDNNPAALIGTTSALVTF
jgi:hypothetical protein